MAPRWLQDGSKMAASKQAQVQVQVQVQAQAQAQAQVLFLFGFLASRPTGLPRRPKGSPTLPTKPISTGGVAGGGRDLRGRQDQTIELLW